jgi:hypothetical protein
LFVVLVWDHLVKFVGDAPGSHHGVRLTFTSDPAALFADEFAAQDWAEKLALQAHREAAGADKSLDEFVVARLLPRQADESPLQRSVELKATHAGAERWLVALFGTDEHVDDVAPLRCDALHCVLPAQPDGLSSGAVAAIVVAVLVCVAASAGLGVWFVMRRRKRVVFA